MSDSLAVIMACGKLTNIIKNFKKYPKLPNNAQTLIESVHLQRILSQSQADILQVMD